MSHRATQAKLLATLPTPKEARVALRLAKAEVSEKRRTVVKQKLDIKAGQGEIEKCLATVETVEGDWLEAGEGSAEDLASAGLVVESIRALDTAERAHDTLVKALPYLAAELKQAELRLRGARGDMRAIAEGRRK